MLRFVHWITLNPADHVSTLKRRFPREGQLGMAYLANFPEQLTERQLDWPREHGAPVEAWVEFSTGNIVLIEAVGLQEQQMGRFEALLWVASSDQVVRLAAPVRYDRYGYAGGPDKFPEQARDELIDLLRRSDAAAWMSFLGPRS